MGYLQALVGGARFVGFTRLGTALFANTGRGIIGLFSARLPVAAYTWGAVIVLERPGMAGDARLVAHELEHTRQSFALGPLMPVVYVLASLVAVLRGGHWYRDNRLEVAARAAGEAAVESAR